MSFVPAFLIASPSADMKSKLQRIGATWSPVAGGYFLTAEQKERIESGDIPTPVAGKDVVIEDLISEWRVSGNTYPKRDAIKRFGGKWQPSTKSWGIPRNKASLEELEAALG